MPASANSQMAPTQLIANPLWAYASSTYAWSLWYLSASDVTNLMSAQDVNGASVWSPTVVNTLTNPSNRTKDTSFVVAEDSGLYPNYRVPGFPINYNIQSVEFDTTFSHLAQYRSSNAIVGTMKIVEPYGVTFIESLLAASYDPSTKSYVPYTQAPYMLQLEFFGYDDNGNLISPTAAAQLKKRFPIRLLQCKVQLTKEGAEYTLKFCAWGQQGLDNIYGKLPKAFNIKGGNVGEILADLENQLNTHYINDQKVAQNAVYADQYKFKIDPAIAKSTIVNNPSLAQSDPNSDVLDFSKKNIPISAGTEILAIIDRIFSQAGYLVQDQLQLGTTNAPAANTSTASQGDPVKIVRTQVSVQLQGVSNNKDNPPQLGVVDPARNKFPFLITYAIGPYSSYKSESVWTGALADSTPITVKQYDYLYTGQNIDVVDFKLDFDMAYYTAALGYTGAIAGQTPTSGSALNTPQSAAGVSKATIGEITLGYDAFRTAPNMTPLLTQYTVADASKTSGGGISNDPNGQKGADVLASIYSKALGDMIKVSLEILGDPMWIKQDDWLYIQDPTNTSSEYNKWDQADWSQDKFFAKYGHIRTDVSDIAVTLNINTPIDIDLDMGAQGNAGLMYPSPGSRPSTFSGQYRVIMVKNIFKNGKFSQVLTLVRYVNTDLIKAYYNNILNTGQSNQVIAGTAYTGPRQR
jgi:hypothetical protein